ncbi:alpha/beta hydrolase, partial [bacterium]|nr:alpha/beta hydrolase [bacterium]
MGVTRRLDTVLSFVLVATLASLACAQESRPDRPLPPGVEAKKDVEYGKVGERSLELDIYRKTEHPKEAMPAVIWIHGGGWSGGDKKDPFPAPALLEKGFVVLSINYRLSGEAKFPAAVEDSKCAVRFLRESAKDLGVDPDRIGVWGGSAGGHLALMLGCADEKAGLEGKGGHEGVSSKVRCVCSWFGPADLTVGDDKFQGGSGQAQRAFLGGTQKEKPELYKQASPVTYVTKDASPTLLVHGDKDPVVPFEQSEILFKKMKEAGVDV